MLPTHINGSGRKHSSLQRRSAMLYTYLRRIVKPKQMDFE